MVRAWIADVSPLYQEECYKGYYEGLPPFRRKKADAARSVQGRAQSAGVWILWEKIRAEYHLPESSVYNLSHSGDYVMCAAKLDPGEAQVGCDIERMKDIRLKIARRFFCEEEYRTIEGAKEDEERRDLFYRYWVLKESFMKATRQGMAMPLDAFSIQLGNPPVLIKQPGEYTAIYYYREFGISGLPYRMAVCTTDKEIDSEIHTELRL